MRILLIALFTLSSSLLTVKAQQPNLDSLWNVWQDEKQADTNRLKAINEFAQGGYVNSKPDSAFYFAQLGYDFAQEKGLKKYMARALGIQGTSHKNRNNYPEALEYYQQSVGIFKELDEKRSIAGGLINIGIVYEQEADYPKALEYCEAGVKICEEIGEKQFLVIALQTIGDIYSYQGNYPKAKAYFQKISLINEELGNKIGTFSALNSLGAIYKEQGNYLKALNNYEKCLEIAQELEHTNAISVALGNIGATYTKLGQYPKALEFVQKNLILGEKLGDKRIMAFSYLNIGAIYDLQSTYNKALEYFQKSLEIYKEIDDKPQIANTLNNMGLLYSNQAIYNQALEYYQKSLVINEGINNKLGITNVLGNIGIIYDLQGSFTKAMEYYQKSLAISEELGDISGMASTLNNLGLLLTDQENYSKALSYCQKSFELSKNIKILEQQKTACECLYNINKAMGNGNKALEYHEQMNALDDSLNAQETHKKLQQMEFAKQVIADSLANAEEARFVAEAHKEEVRKKNQTRNMLIGVSIIVILLAVSIYARLSYVRKSKAVLQKEKDQSENLLLNILPADIAKELKEKGKADARDFDLVSIVFTDFKSFTQASEKLTAAELVGEINTCFEAFDAIMEKYGIEKIKTIGDAYMAAGGLPIPKDDSVKNTVLAALEMQAFISKRKVEKEAAGQPAFEMRCGIHTGPVVAGIVGIKKFQYDIWGDTVNTASRMESHGEVGKVNISEATYEILKSEEGFEFEAREMVNVKGKGDLAMFFVKLNEGPDDQTKV